MNVISGRAKFLRIFVKFHRQSFISFTCTPRRSVSVIEQLIENLNEKRSRTESKGKESQLTQSQVPQKSIEFICTAKKNINKEDAACDAKILGQLGDLKVALETLKSFADLSRYPRRETLRTLILQSGAARTLEGMNLVRSVLQNAYPQEYLWEMGYQHYVAEYHWKSGDYALAADLFEKLLTEHPKRRKKIADLLMFMQKNIVNRQLDEELDVAMEMAKRCSAKRIHQPIVNLWFLLLTSPSGRHNYFAKTILEPFSADELQSTLANKVDRIIEIAIKENNMDLLQRFIPTVTVFSLTDKLTKLYDSLLTLQCENQDVFNACQTFHYSCKKKIILSANTIQMFHNLLKLGK